MNGKNKVLYLSIIVILLALSVFPNRQVLGSEVKQEEESFQRIDTYLEQQLEKLNVPAASLVIVEGGQIVHTQGFGDTGYGARPAPQTPFFIGSLTKSFTALAVIQLVEEGKVDLDAPLQNYLPWFTLADPQAAAQITIRHLLIQTSGFSQLPGMLGLANFDDSVDAVEQQARALAETELARPVGSAFEYSNVNFNLLGLVVEAASGDTYADYVQKHIFTPLDMLHSYTSKAAAQTDGLAVGHEQWYGFPVSVPNLAVPAGSLPSGQLIASAEDMGHYLIAQLNSGSYAAEQVLSSGGMDLMHQAAASTSESGISLGGDYGMGWFVTESEEGQRIWHYGEVPDYYAYMALLPGQNKGIVLLVNTNHQMYTFALLSAAEGAVDLLSGIEPAANQWGLLPWILRLLWLLPLLQVFIVVKFIRRNRKQARSSFSDKGWGKRITRIILPGLLNFFMLAGAAALIFSGMLNFMMLFMGDICVVLLAGAVIALVWFGLLICFFARTLRKA